MAMKNLSRIISSNIISPNSQQKFLQSNQKFQFLSHFPLSPFQTTKNFSANSQYREQILLANTLQRYGFPPSQTHDFLGKNRFLLNFTLVDIETALGILLKLKLPQKSIVSILYACPRVLQPGFLKKWETTFSELRNLNLSTLLIKSVLEDSVKLNIEPNDLSRCLQDLKGLGLREETVVRVLEGFPGVITMRLRDIEHRIEFLKGFRITLKEIDGICCVLPNVLGFGVEERLKPLFDEFGSLGFGKKKIREEIVENPRILGMEAGEMSRCVELVNGLKCRAAIEEKIMSKGALRAGFEVKLRVDCLCRHGMMRREAFKVVYKEPRVILYDVEDIEKKIEFLKCKLGMNIGCLVEVPEYLGVHFEKQIVLRYDVLQYLRSKGGLGCEVGLRGMIKPSRQRFYNLYVKPYPECEQIFGKFSRDNEIKHQRPVGLWKLFKPPKYTDTEEDLKNMKSIMKAL
ncbi:hypothetical protein ACHQM5_006622 [Ranunculus cassubicifolius]